MNKTLVNALVYAGTGLFLILSGFAIHFVVSLHQDMRSKLENMQSEIQVLRTEIKKPPIATNNFSLPSPITPIPLPVASEIRAQVTKEKKISKTEANDIDADNEKDNGKITLFDPTSAATDGKSDVKLLSVKK